MRKRLLVVVDDWEALEVYESRLEAHFELTLSPFGNEGIRLAQSEKPDRILLDLTFEDMHAEEAIVKLREDARTREIPLTVILREGEGLATRLGFPGPRDRVFRRPYKLPDLVAQLDE